MAKHHQAKQLTGSASLPRPTVAPTANGKKRVEIKGPAPAPKREGRNASVATADEAAESLFKFVGQANKLPLPSELVASGGLGAKIKSLHDKGIGVLRVVGIAMDKVGLEELYDGGVAGESIPVHLDEVITRTFAKVHRTLTPEQSFAGALLTMYYGILSRLAVEIGESSPIPIEHHVATQVAAMLGPNDPQQIVGYIFDEEDRVPMAA